ncbi:hypothetical protein [Moorena sp. SIO4A5]|uniref:hypothetical protein n=1 Tax=Moorena sp. SIO4A5 TaxID=2607838 RepID=UPI0025CDE78C|nr:hypothetical protein [Moorena sp. SIO4A5]
MYVIKVRTAAVGLVKIIIKFRDIPKAKEKAIVTAVKTPATAPAIIPLIIFKAAVIAIAVAPTTALAPKAHTRFWKWVTIRKTPTRTRDIKLLPTMYSLLLTVKTRKSTAIIPEKAEPNAAIPDNNNDKSIIIIFQ